MPKNKFQDVVFTIIMAAIMVYGMVVYNIALNTGCVFECYSSVTYVTIPFFRHNPTSRKRLPM